MSGRQEPIARIRVGTNMIGDGCLTYVIAEMACAHEGKPDLAHRLVDIAADAGANAVQLQLLFVKCLVVPSHPNYAKSLALEIPYTEWPEIIAHARERDLSVWANVFDEDALKVAMQEDVDALKLHSSDLSNPYMLDAVGSTGKPISLAVGGSTIDEITQAVVRLRERGTTDLILMHGYQGYPTASQDCRLRVIGTLRNILNCPVGYQDHTDGASELAIILPLAAIGLGACVLEKHYTDNRARHGTDYESALDPDDLARFVQLVSNTDTAFGYGSLQPMSAAELKYRAMMKKSIVAARPIKKGETITENMLAFMRAASGLMPSEAAIVVGRQSQRDIPQFEPVTLAVLEPVASGNDSTEKKLGLV